MTLPRQDVEFRTLDGLTLRAWLYPAEKRGPGIIMTPGVSIYFLCFRKYDSKYDNTQKIYR